MPVLALFAGAVSGQDRLSYEGSISATKLPTSVAETRKLARAFSPFAVCAELLSRELSTLAASYGVTCHDPTFGVAIS
jgi:hypothetical protein